MNTGGFILMPAEGWNDDFLPVFPLRSLLSRFLDDRSIARSRLLRLRPGNGSGLTRDFGYRVCRAVETMTLRYRLTCDSCAWVSQTNDLTNAEWASDFHVERFLTHTVTCTDTEKGKGIWTVTQKVPRRSSQLAVILAEDCQEDFWPDESTD